MKSCKPKADRCGRRRILYCGPALALLLVLGAAGVSAQVSALPSFEQIIAPSARPHADSCALMASWVAAHPRDERAPRGLIWMAQLRMADHQGELARPLFWRVKEEYPGTEWALHATKGLADLDLAAHRYGAALAGYDALARSGSPFFVYVGKMATAHAQKERWRLALTLGLLASLLALWGVRLWRLRTWRALWPPPSEVIYPLPLLIVMGVSSISPPEGEGRGVLLLALFALVLLWCSGAYLRARPPVGMWRLLHGILGLAQTAALLYAAIVLGGLWDKFHDTLVMGAE